MDSHVNGLNRYVFMQVSPFAQLDLADYACQELLVSFAVTNKAGLSNFSLPNSLIVFGGWLSNSS